MTTEEKAKAYDEALERAKKQRVDYQKELDKTDKNSQLAGLLRAGISAIDMAFPELAESEDENLKNKSGYYKAGKFWKASTLWNAVKGKSPQRVPNRYILQECTWNISSLKHFADEVKNVQEVDLNYPIILDMNGNILDGAHRVVKAYLEGKDIDIVYLGDDEWPEPDYDEEKAVKESEDERIRKGLLRHFRNKTKPYWNEIAVKDIIVYLEKQKDLDKMIVVSPEVWDNAISEAYENGKKEGEKQKEQKLISFNKHYNPDDYEVVIEGNATSLKQKEQKPSSKFRPGDWVVYDGPLGHAILQVKDVVGGRYSFVDNVSTLLVEDSDKFLRPITPEDVEKPTECLKAKRDCWYVCIRDFYSGGKKQCSVGDLVQAKGGMYMMGMEDISEWFRRAYYEDVRDAFGPNTDTNIPEKPAEWSEEDERMLSRCIKSVECSKQFADSESYKAAKDVEMNWLKSLPERFNLESKEEWSVEDEKMMENIQYALRYACANSVIDEQTIEYVMTWLKSLRPSWKPTEDQMEALERTVRLANFGLEEDRRKALASLYEQLKSIQ